MAANLTMQLNTEEVLQLNSSIKSIKSDIDSYFSSINSELSKLSSAIGSSSITFMISDIYSTIEALDKRMASNIDELIAFLDKQMGNYQETTVEATKMLRQALEFINQNFVNAQTV